MSSAVVVRHNFETAHRLPFLGGKCENLHGHSWWTEVTIATPDDVSIVTEFGKLKAGLRGWIDRELDHGAMLGAADPLTPLLEGLGSKLLVFHQTNVAAITAGLAWPTVENVARLIARVATAELEKVERAPRCRVSRVVVRETHVNEAIWAPSSV